MACIQGLPNNMLYEGWISITCKFTKNSYGPMNNSISIVPTTYLGESSYALAVIVLGNIFVESTSISFSTCFGSTFKAEPLSVNTLPMYSLCT